jgi:hypothetical protein
MGKYAKTGCRGERSFARNPSHTSRKKRERTKRRAARRGAAGDGGAGRSDLRTANWELLHGRRRQEEAVQGAGMLGPSPAQRAAESHASVRLGVRSHVPGRQRARAQADEAGIRKAKPLIKTSSVGIRRWAVFPKGSAHEPPPENRPDELGGRRRTLPPGERHRHPP